MAISGTAMAQEGEPDADWKISYSGYGTLGAVYHTAPNVEFRRDIGQLGGTPANHLGFSPDSNLGLQLTARYGRSFETSVQTVARKNAHGDYGPEIAWAYVKYRPEDNFSVRLGRLGLEFYPQGDSAEIGYANLMIRQQVIFYPRTFDGADVEWSTPVGAGLVRAKAQGGRVVGHVVQNGTAYDSSGSSIGSFTVEYAQGGWTARLANGTLKLSHEMTDSNILALRDALSAIVPISTNAQSILDRLAMRGRSFEYSTAVVAYDSDRLQGSLGYSQESSAHWPTRTIVYGNVGYRIAAWTPYLGVSIQQTDRRVIPLDVPIPQLVTASGIAQVSQGVNQSSFAMGVRYDLTRNTALKFQLDHIRYKDPEGVIDAAVSATSMEGRRNKSINVLSVALDFIF